MMLKPKNHKEELEEDDFADEDEEDPQDIKRAVGNGSKSNQRDQITPAEVVDIIEGHLARANQLLQYLKN